MPVIVSAGIGVMKTRREYPKIESVAAEAGRRLRVVFENGATRLYDCAPLLKDPVFAPLRDAALFRSVRADPHGYGVVWTDELDLAESEIWLHGRAPLSSGMVREGGGTPSEKASASGGVRRGRRATKYPTARKRRA